MYIADVTSIVVLNANEPNVRKMTILGDQANGPTDSSQVEGISEDVVIADTSVYLDVPGGKTSFMLNGAWSVFGG